MTLLTVKDGKTAHVDGVKMEAHGRERLLELGFIAGERVRVLRRAPLGGPLQVVVRDTCYAVSRQHAAQIALVKLAK